MKTFSISHEDYGGRYAIGLSFRPFNWSVRMGWYTILHALDDTEHRLFHVSWPSDYDTYHIRLWRLAFDVRPTGLPVPEEKKLAKMIPLVQDLQRVESDR